MSYPTLDDAQTLYRWMYYGDPGNGKTTCIAAAAHLGRVVYIDADKGLKAQALRRHDIPIENIEPHHPDSYQDYWDLFMEVGQRLDDGEDIFAVAWDTTTKAQERFMELHMQRQVEKARAIGKQRSEFDIWQEDWGEIAGQMKKLLRQIHRLNCHVLLGAHQRRDTEDEGQVRISPSLSPATFISFSGWMDGICHCRTDEFDDPTLEDGLEFTGLNRPKGRFVAKDRFGALPKVMANPMFDRVVAYLDGDLNRDSDPLQQRAKARRSSPDTMEEPSSSD